VTDLLTRLAEESGRELDAALAEFQGWDVFYTQDAVGQAVAYCVWGDVKKGEKGPLPRFTSSVDAALTLVPEGWHVESLGFSERSRKWFCKLALPAPEAMRVKRQPFGEVKLTNHGAHTLQNAICIAALKAKGVE